MTAKSDRPDEDVRIVPTGACYDCGGRCVIKVHVQDGVARRIESDDGEEPQLRACARGYAMRRQVYSPERLRFPQKRMGGRGEGRFERITWDEALDTVAAQLIRIKGTYGAKAIMLMTLSGGSGSLHVGPGTLWQLLGSFGGYTTFWGDASAEGAILAGRALYGTLTCGNNREDLVNSRLIIVWGANPATSIFSTNTMFHLAKAREAGIRIVVIDPRYTTTASTVADRWIPIKPGTDTAMMAAMAYQMIAENLHDQRFLNRYTVGFEKFRDYVLGKEDGVAKTSSWAEAKTGVPADTTIWLAREYATRKPAALVPGFAPGRTAFGEEFHRMAATLAAMTGNVGIHGGGAAGFERTSIAPMVPPGYSKHFEGGSYQERLKQLDVPRRLRTKPHCCCAWDWINKGTAGGSYADIKMCYIAFANPLNQLPNINKGIEALKKMEFIVVHEQFMTPTARFADIILPVTHVWERYDISRPWLGGAYYLYGNKAIEAVLEVKSDRDICRALATRLGLKDPAWDLPEEEALRRVAEGMEDVIADVGDYEEFKKKGVYKIRRPEPAICFEKQIANPEHHPFSTPSGRIEIYSQLLADLSHPEIPPIPKHIDSWEGPEDPLAKKYPLQLITVHQKNRAHSCFDNNPVLREIEPQALGLSKKDAETRGVTDGELVRVFNDRGETIVPARVTECIMPGVVSLGEGAWYRPDDKGRDRAGSPNILTPDRHAPSGAFPYNTCLVQVEKFREE